MVLVHTEEELLATEEPAICVIGAFSYQTEEKVNGKPYDTRMCKVYARAVLVNDAFENEENYLFDEVCEKNEIRCEDSGYVKFFEEAWRLLFGDGVDRENADWQPIPGGGVHTYKVYERG